MNTHISKLIGLKRSNIKCNFSILSPKLLLILSPVLYICTVAKDCMSGKRRKGKENRKSFQGCYQITCMLWVTTV